MGLARRLECSTMSDGSGRGVSAEQPSVATRQQSGPMVRGGGSILEVGSRTSPGPWLYILILVAILMQFFFEFY